VKIRKSAVLLSLEVLMLGSLVGCWWSGGGSLPTNVVTQGQSGKVTQGAVSGATVWADSLTSGTRFVIDTAEQPTQTTTSATGTFTFPVQPSYKYVVVSQGGTDTITGKPATTMLAPAGAKSVSALTTLVALDTTGTLAASINAILPSGTTFDSDITAANGLTPAAMVAITSIETAVTTFNQTVQDATKTGSTLTQQQQNNINLTVYSQIATTLSGSSSGSLANTANLASNLTTALTTAATTIATNNTNITLTSPSTIASSIATNAVATSANVVGIATSNAALQSVTPSTVVSAPVTVSTSTSVTETTVMTTSNTALVNSTVTTVATTAATSVTATSTPTTYTPPVIAVANNPTIVGYQLAVNASGSSWNVSTLTITFSDNMVATASGSSSYANSVLNPANYQFTQSGCSPASYSANVVTFSCGSLTPGAFGITVNKATSSSGVWASSTSLGLSVDNVKTFTLPTVTGSTGGSSLDMF